MSFHIISAVSVGFTNKSVTLREGGATKTLCVDMKTGLDLDPHDIVTLVMVPVPQELGMPMYMQVTVIFAFGTG